MNKKKSSSNIANWMENNRANNSKMSDAGLMFNQVGGWMGGVRVSRAEGVAQWRPRRGCSSVSRRLSPFSSKRGESTRVNITMDVANNVFRLYFNCFTSHFFVEYFFFFSFALLQNLMTKNLIFSKKKKT